MPDKFKGVKQRKLTVKATEGVLQEKDVMWMLLLN